MLVNHSRMPERDKDFHEIPRKSTIATSSKLTMGNFLLRGSCFEKSARGSISITYINESREFYSSKLKYDFVWWYESFFNLPQNEPKNTQVNKNNGKRQKNSRTYNVYLLYECAIMPTLPLHPPLPILS